MSFRGFVFEALINTLCTGKEGNGQCKIEQGHFGNKSRTEDTALSTII